jgi:hypothetical protein
MENFCSADCKRNWVATNPRQSLPTFLDGASLSSSTSGGSSAMNRKSALIALGVVVALSFGFGGVAGAVPHPKPGQYWTMEFVWQNTTPECAVQRFQPGGDLSSGFNGTYSVGSKSVKESLTTPMSQIEFHGTWSKKAKQYSGRMVVTGYQPGTYPARLFRGIVKSWKGSGCVGSYSEPGPGRATTTKPVQGLVVVPAIVGEPLPVASNALRQAGLVGTVEGGSPQGNGEVLVAKQSPPAGTHVKNGTLVTLTLVVK